MIDRKTMNPTKADKLGLSRVCTLGAMLRRNQEVAIQTTTRSVQSAANASPVVIIVVNHFVKCYVTRARQGLRPAVL